MVHIFLINPIAGDRNYAQVLREEIAQLRGIKYYIFNIRYAGYETELMRELEELFIEEDRIRIYSCGGSGTLKHILDGIHDFNKVELAFYPAGMTNDFMKVFGGDAAKFKHIQNLVYGKVVNVDYIDSDIGRALNSVSTGLDTVIVENTIKGHQLLPSATTIIYIYSILSGIFSSRSRAYTLKLDDETCNTTAAEIAVGNGCVLGGVLKVTDRADIADGKCRVSIVGKVNGPGLLPYFNAFMKGNYEFINSKCIRRDVESMTIKSLDSGNLSVNMDGEIVAGGKEFRLWIVKEGLKFVLPNEVMLP